MSASGLIGSSMECQRAHEFEDNWLHPALDETLELFATSSRSYLPSFARFMKMDDFFWVWYNKVWTQNSQDWVEPTNFSLCICKEKSAHPTCHAVSHGFYRFGGIWTKALDLKRMLTNIIHRSSLVKRTLNSIVCMHPSESKSQCGSWIRLNILSNK